MFDKADRAAAASEIAALRETNRSLASTVATLVGLVGQLTSARRTLDDATLLLNEQVAFAREAQDAAKGSAMLAHELTKARGASGKNDPNAWARSR